MITVLLLTAIALCIYMYKRKPPEPVEELEPVEEPEPEIVEIPHRTRERPDPYCCYGNIILNEVWCNHPHTQGMLRCEEATCMITFGTITAEDS